MRKLFTLLTLLAVFGGSKAWAEDISCSANLAGVDASSGSSAGTNCTITWTGLASTADITVGNIGYYKLNSDDAYVQLTLNEGSFIAGDVLTVSVSSNGDNKTVGFKLKSSSGNGSTVKISKKSTAANITYTLKAEDIEEDGSIKIFRNGSNVRFYSFSVTGERIDPTAPTLTADPSALTVRATESGQAVTGTFTITGSNLTDGSYDLTVPTVAGLSVSPTQITVTDGTVNQIITVSYSATKNVHASKAEIIVTVGELSQKVVVNYSASVAEWTLQPVSAAASWDWSKITVNTESERYADNGIKLEGTTDPTNDDDVVYENYNGGDMTIASGFDGTTMAFKGQYPIRNNNMCQNGTLHFKTTVPGNITVKFSDTGSSVSATATPRYLIVNGVQTQYWTSRPTSGTTKSNDTKTTGDIYVPAGDVTITGSQPICIYIVTFTPVEELPTVDVTVGELGYRTFTSKNPLDFTTPVEGLTAYTASVEGDNVSFIEVTGPVPAGTGLLLKANQGTYTISVPAENPEAVDNAFVGVTVETVVNGAGIYILYNGDQGLGFYKTTAESFTVGANTAYLPASIGAVVGNARSFIALHNETTGIQTAETAQPASADCYNLNGQRIAQPAKGLYIKNGQKYLVK